MNYRVEKWNGSNLEYAKHDLGSLNSVAGQAQGPCYRAKFVFKSKLN